LRLIGCAEAPSAATSRAQQRPRTDAVPASADSGVSDELANGIRRIERTLGEHLDEVRGVFRRLEGTLANVIDATEHSAVAFNQFSSWMRDFVDPDGTGDSPDAGATD
jgi:hypothetical protein